MGPSEAYAEIKGWNWWLCRTIYLEALMGSGDTDSLTHEHLLKISEG